MSIVISIVSCDLINNPIRPFLAFQTARATFSEGATSNPVGKITSDGYINAPSTGALTLNLPIENKQNLTFTANDNMRLSFADSLFNGMENRESLISSVQIAQTSSNTIKITYPASFMAAAKSGGDISPTIWLCHPENRIDFGTTTPVKVRCNDKPSPLTEASLYRSIADSKIVSLAFALPTKNAAKSKVAQISINGEIFNVNYDENPPTFQNQIPSVVNLSGYLRCGSANSSFGGTGFLKSLGEVSSCTIKMIDCYGLSSEPTVIQAISEIVFVDSSGTSQIYHAKSGCSGATEEMALSEAVAQGKKPCRICTAHITKITSQTASTKDFTQDASTTSLNSAAIQALFTSPVNLSVQYDDGGSDEIKQLSDFVLQDIDASITGTKEIFATSGPYAGKTLNPPVKIDDLSINVKPEPGKCVKPVISVSGNIVEITSSTAGVTIYYTTDGSVPTTSSTQYNASSKPNITNVSTSVIKAIAAKTEMRDSDVATCNICTVSFSEDGGTVSSGTLITQKVHAGGKATKPNVTLTKTGFENFDGSTGTWAIGTPATDFDFNTTITQNVTLKPKWVALGVSGQPTISWDSETTNRIKIEATAGVAIYYTTDGSTPTTSSTRYDPANKPDATALSGNIIKAIAVENGKMPSGAVSFPQTGTISIFDVTFDLDGGTGTAPDTQKVHAGGKATKPNVTLTKAGFENFDGSTGTWAIGTPATDFDFNTTITQNVTLKPKWVALGVSVQPTISWDSETTNRVKIEATAGVAIYYTTDGSTPTTSSTRYDPANKPDATALSGNTIKAIAVENGKMPSSAISFPQTGNISIFDVTFDLDGGTGTAPDTQKIHSGGKATKPASSVTSALTKVDAQGKHYDFDDWGETSGGTSSFDFDTAITASKTLYAKWEEWEEGDEPTFSVGSDNKITITAQDATAIKYTITISGGTEGAEQTYSSPIDISSNTGTVTIKATAEYAQKNPATATKAIHEVHFNLDGGTINGNTTIASQRVLDGGKATKPQPDPTRSDSAIFIDWFAIQSDSTISETAFDFDGTITESVELIASWNTNIYYVASNGSNLPLIGNGTESKPFASIKKAIEKINSVNDGTSQYIIYVDGTLTGGNADVNVLGLTLGGITLSKTLNLTIQPKPLSSATLDTGTISTGYGAVGIDSSYITLTLKNLTITGKTYELGGAIYAKTGNLIIDSCTIQNNVPHTLGLGSGTGGGIHIENSTVTLKGNTVITENTSKSGTGNGIYFDGGTLNIQDGVQIGGTGDTKNNDVYLTSGKFITVTGTLSSGASINITPATTTAGTVVVQAGTGYTLTDADLAKFHVLPENLNMKVALETTGSNAGKGVLKAKVLPTEYYVSSTGSNSNNGTTATTAFASMQKAIDEVIAENEINAVPYMIHVSGEITGDNAKVDISTNVTSALNLTIQGTNKANDKLNRNLTTATSSGQVIKIGSANATVTISDLTITGGNTTTSDRGAGVFVDKGANVTITDCAITGNKSGDFGGGLSSLYYSTKVKLVRTSITGNTGKNGAGIHVASGDITLEDCTITGNTFTTASSGTKGKGVSLEGGTLNVQGGFTTVDASDATKNNDVYSGNIITVTGALTGGINITPATTTAGTVVVEPGTGYTLTDADLAKFHVLPETLNMEVAFGTGANAGKGVLKAKAQQQGGGIGTDDISKYTVTITGIPSPSIQRGNSFTVSVTATDSQGNAVPSSNITDLNVKLMNTSIVVASSSNGTINILASYPVETYQVVVQCKINDFLFSKTVNVTVTE